MKIHKRVAGTFAALAVAVVLSGCSGWSYDPPLRGNASLARYNLSTLRGLAPGSPTDFNQGLIADYAGLAGSLQDELKDWADADYFARKGIAVTRGKDVPPENNRNWLIPLEVPDKFRTELADGRARLIAAFDKGARERLPLFAARAQVSYDCWVERMEDDWQNAVKGPCRQQFFDALARLEGRAETPPAARPAATPMPGREYRVYFEFDRAEILPEAQQILLQIAALAKQSPDLKILLVGKADRSGGDAYNLQLSRRRADAVHDALTKAGVAKSRLETRWVGEREPPVPTADNVREPRNRVVEINLR
jgi:OmpA-OmpF porin, OOP family